MKPTFTYLTQSLQKLAFLLLLLLAGISVRAQQVKPAVEPAKQAQISVYIFLAETCPISQFYTLTLKELHKEFASERLTFKGIFPGKESTKESVTAFNKKYELPFPLLLDSEQKLAKALNATITPEVIVKNEISGEILYQGRIDDSYFKVGKKRPAAREHDLRNALIELKNNQPVSKPKTEAVGCYITFLP